MLEIMNWGGWGFLAAVIGSVVYYVARHLYVKRMLEVFELGHKMGRASALMPKEAIDELLRSAGIDPAVLPPRQGR